MAKLSLRGTFLFVCAVPGVNAVPAPTIVKKATSEGAVEFGFGSFKSAIFCWKIFALKPYRESL